MATEAVLAAATPQLRLHPWSWLFVLLAQLRNFALPLLALLVFGQGGGWEQWQLYGALAGGALALVSVVQYFTYRYGVIGSDLVIRAGILNRTSRTIPLARIRNVSLHRTLLHRLFGVAEVRLESAGGTTAEAHMRVLSLDAASALERLVQVGHGRDAAAVDADAADANVLLRLPTVELVRLGLISNRGVVVLGAAFAAASQMVPGDPEQWFRPVGRWLFGQAEMLQMGWLATVLVALALLLGAVVLLRLLSIVLAIVQFHGFTLRERDGVLGVESGLLTRVRAHAPLRKIQFWCVSESLLHRLFRRRSLDVETAVSAGEGKDSSRSINHLAPVATAGAVAALVQRLLPEAGYPAFDWQPLHPRAWRRLCFWPLLLTLLAGLGLGLRFGAPGLLPLLLLPWWVLRARRLAAATGWALNGTVVAYRSGWLNRHTAFAELAKLQGVQVLHGPFDRRRGMATVAVDTAGAAAIGERIHIRFLPEAEARRLAAQLGRHIARNPLAW